MSDFIVTGMQEGSQNAIYAIVKASRKTKINIETKHNAHVFLHPGTCAAENKQAGAFPVGFGWNIMQNVAH